MSRDLLIDDFLDDAGWGPAERIPMPGDASSRRYVRLRKGGERAILMNQPPGAETSACPEDATPEERHALGYNAVARLAGPDVRPFAAIGLHLRACGFSAPAIIASDYANGFLLLEDLGDDLYARAIERGADSPLLYAAAIDVLSRLHTQGVPSTLSAPGGFAMPLLAYDETALIAEAELLIDWFLPVATGTAVHADQRAEYQALWRRVLAPVLQDEAVLVLRDYHAENLLWLPERRGEARVGLIDFQDGLAGSRAYDLISLTEDARRDVPPDLARAMLERYAQSARGHDRHFDEPAFRMAAAVLAAQRNAKIIGIFTRLWKRDGKPRYPLYHPRLWRYLENDLAHPALAPLKAWFDKNIPPDRRLAAVRAVEAAI
ncbi:MAG: phosphotransferase [Alphaproteobacteria bacterium]|nr:phosphotransferase [Alphaproteobacteria bacterium]